MEHDLAVQSWPEPLSSACQNAPNDPNHQFRLEQVPTQCVQHSSLRRRSCSHPSVIGLRRLCDVLVSITTWSRRTSLLGLWRCRWRMICTENWQASFLVLPILFIWYSFVNHCLFKFLSPLDVFILLCTFILLFRALKDLLTYII